MYTYFHDSFLYAKFIITNLRIIAAVNSEDLYRELNMVTPMLSVRLDASLKNLQFGKRL